MNLVIFLISCSLSSSSRPEDIEFIDFNPLSSQQQQQQQANKISGMIRIPFTKGRPNSKQDLQENWFWPFTKREDEDIVMSHQRPIIIPESRYANDDALNPESHHGWQKVPKDPDFTARPIKHIPRRKLETALINEQQQQMKKKRIISHQTDLIKLAEDRELFWVDGKTGRKEKTIVQFEADANNRENTEKLIDSLKSTEENKIQTKKIGFPEVVDFANSENKKSGVIIEDGIEYYI